LLRVRKFPVAFGYILVLLWANAYICRDLFFAEYTGHVNSIQGLWISMARLAGGHWFQPSWWPYHDGGIPFEHTYMPLVPGATALYAKLGHVSAARAFNAIAGVVYCLAPVALFVMAWRMTRLAGVSFCAALAFSLTSPARALIRDPNLNLSLIWSSRRLYTMAVWDDVPHQAAMCFLPFAILFLWLSFKERRLIYYVAAGVFIALSALASVFGATAMVMVAICMLAVLPAKDLRWNLILTATIGGLAYLVVSPFLPPSLIATIRSNQQMFPEDQWSVRSFTALSIVALGWVLLWRILRRWVDDLEVRFFVLFAFVATSIPMMDTYGNRHFLPQPGRYMPEMEFGLALAVVFLIRLAWGKLPRSIGIAVGVFLLSLAGEQVAGHRHYAKEIIWPVDMSGRIEYRVAKWVDRNMPGQRVMVPGSIAQWFNVFSDAPQLSGGSYSTTPNWNQQDAMVSVLSGVGPKEAEMSILWLKAFGVQAVTVCGPKSTEFWKAYADPKKFEGLLPVLWSEDDTTFYKVPQRSASLAHLIPPSAVTRKPSRLSLSKDELEKYVAALDDPALPLAEFRWDGFRRAMIRTTAKADQLVSVQTAYHSGWHARANGRAAEVRRDGLGFLLIEPRCDGPCEIELSYDGGWEYRLCRWLSLLTVIGVLGFCGFRLFRKA
jgi:hypothetical protein